VNEQQRLSVMRVQRADGLFDDRQQQLRLHAQALPQDLIGDLDGQGQQLIGDALVDAAHRLLQVVHQGRHGVRRGLRGSDAFLVAGGIAFRVRFVMHALDIFGCWQDQRRFCRLLRVAAVRGHGFRVFRPRQWVIVQACPGATPQVAALGDVAALSCGASASLACSSNAATSQRW
jgi:hypothetical protein